MTREFFAPEQKRWVAPSIHLASASMLRLDSLNCTRQQSCLVGLGRWRIESLSAQFDDLLSLGDPPGAQSHHWIARAIATSAHCASRRPTISVTSSAAFWAALFSKRSTFSDALAPALSLRLRRIRHGTQKEFRMNSRLSRSLGW